MVSMLEDVIDRGTGSAGAHRLRRALSGRRQDRHDRRLQGRLVRRLHLVDRRRRLGRARTSRRRSAARATARATRCRSGADFIKAAARKRRRARFRAADGMREEQLCKVSYLKPVEGVPGLHRVLQGRRSGPVAALPDPPGNGEAADQARGEGILLRARPEAERDLQVSWESDARLGQR